MKIRVVVIPIACKTFRNTVHVNNELYTGFPCNLIPGMCPWAGIYRVSFVVKLLQIYLTNFKKLIPS
jgi:hypothetical protein